jgi:hypothetical protein
MNLFSNCFTFFFHLEFDTSCFSGEYVTGQKIGDEYFSKLYDLRNDAAKMERINSTLSTYTQASSSSKGAKQSNDGCESVSNDKRNGYNSDDGCESLNNNTSVTVR